MARSDLVTIRFSIAELDIIQRAADAMGLERATFIRSRTLVEAAKIIEWKRRKEIENYGGRR